MALIKSCLGKTPIFGKNVYLAENATLVGDVITGDDCSFWFQSVVRGDVHSIRIGNKVNVQDGAVLHCTYQLSPLSIGNQVSIGHRALVHGCTIEDNVLIGMGAIVMDNAVVESHCLIAAGAVVLENTVCESGYIYAGIPARPVKKMSKEVFQHNIARIANNYVEYASWFKE
jgi:carbonic anhydrase/acetyltransferase-like protein (isoleucine patch superfamily)